MPPFSVDVVTQPGVSSPLLVAALDRLCLCAAFHAAELARLCGRALFHAGAPSPASLTLILSDDEELAALNEQHMGHEGPTDVLSFPLLPPSAFPGHAGQDPAVRIASADFCLPPG